MTQIRSVPEGYLPSFTLDGENEEEGLFLITQTRQDVCYIAVNNLDGRRWVEKFQNRTTAIYWLLGYWVLNIDNELCDGTTGKKIYDIADRVRKGEKWTSQR